jgi:Prolyl oligopeptidase family
LSLEPRRPPDAVEVVPQLRLRQPARLWPRRQEGGDRAAGAAASVIDVNRVGIWGHSGGGFMSAVAMLVYPDSFKVP